jgi:Domain of unknown function (DUF4411)
MAGVWTLVEAAIDDGRVVVPREVYRELLAQDDEITTLVRRHEHVVAEPTEGVQRRAGVFQQMFPKPGLRDLADPFVMAEAAARGFAVVTYEGITFAGERAKKADDKLPALCGNSASVVAHSRKHSAILASACRATEWARPSSTATAGRASRNKTNFRGRRRLPPIPRPFGY